MKFWYLSQRMIIVIFYFLHKKSILTQIRADEMEKFGYGYFIALTSGFIWAFYRLI